MFGVERLIAENVAALQQGIDLLDALDPEVYARDGRFEARSSIGGHIRHCIDFYTALLDGVKVGRIDYTARNRDLRTERDCRYARDRMVDVAALFTLVPDEWPLSTVVVRTEGASADEHAIWSPSSVGRELQVAASHTVHHYAIVAMLLRLEGVEPPYGFGVAPSTLEYWRSLECAR